MDFINYTFKFKYFVMFTGNIKRSVFTASLAGVAFSLPLSEWLLSVFIIILFISWIAAGGVRRIPLLLSQKKNILIFLVTYLIYMVWMINTSDLYAGLNQLRLKLPLVVFPLSLGFSEPLSPRELRIIISSFIAGVVLSSLAGVISGFSSVFSGLTDPKMLSPFISHIRLAMMSVFAIACSAWYFLYCRSGKWYDWLFPVATIWLIVFLFLLISLTGIILLFITLAVSSVIIAFRSVSRRTRIIIALLLTVIVIVSGALVLFSITSFYRPSTAYNFPLLKSTNGGRPYIHDLQKKDIENGNLVWIYICEEELSREWNRHSPIKYYATDKKGQALKYTLIRYMTSAGLTKDSSGFAGMSEKDIAGVENGITNKKFAEWSPWRSKLYEVIWQSDYFLRGGNPSGHSITQRLVYYETGLKIFFRHPLLGTGTGDLPHEYSMQYEKDRSVLDQSHRLLSHNQFLYFLVSFGITGTVIIVWALFYPFFSKRGFEIYLPAIFLTILVLSMLWEDTLETHTGVSFFAYFYSVFIFGTENNESKDKEYRQEIPGKGC
jgi:O-antigen ligase